MPWLQTIAKESKRGLAFSWGGRREGGFGIFAVPLENVILLASTFEITIHGSLEGNWPVKS